MTIILKGNADLLPDLATARTWCAYCDASIPVREAEASYSCTGVYACAFCATHIAHPSAPPDVHHEMTKALAAGGVT